MLNLLERMGDRMLGRFVPSVPAHATQCSPGGSCGTNRIWCYCEYPAGSKYCAAAGAKCL